MRRTAQVAVIFALTMAAMAVGPATAPAPLPAAAAGAAAGVKAVGPASAPQGKQAIAAARIEVCKNGIKDALQQYEYGSGTMDSVSEWSRRMLESQRAAGLPKDQLIVAIQEHLQHLKRVEEDASNRFKSGLAHHVDVLSATYSRLEAEQWLADAQGQ